MSALASGFPYSEAKVADRIGVARTTIKEIRQSEMDVDLDWQKNGGEIALSNRGLKRLWRELRPGVAMFDLRECLLVDPPKKNGVVGVNGAAEPIRLGDEPMPIPMSVTVTQVCVNPYVVRAKDVHGLMQLAWVGKNYNFTVGMSIQVVLDKKNGAWRYIGPMPQRRYTPSEWDRRMKAGFKG